MNNKNVALLSAIGFACSGMVLSPVSAAEEGAITVAKLPGAACSVGGKCSPKGKFFDLSDDQLEKMSALKNSFKDSVGPKFTELMKLKREMKDQLTKESVDKGELLALQAKVNSLKGEIANDRISFMADASAVLTTEQKQKLRRKMLMKNLMGSKHHGGKRFHGKKFHGKKSHGERNWKKSDTGVESNVTTEAPVEAGSEELS